MRCHHYHHHHSLPLLSHPCSRQIAAARQQPSINMGNWLKGRVLIIPENSQQGETQYVNAQNNYQADIQSSPIYYPPYSSSLLQFATEEEQIRLAKRIGLIQHLPTGIYDECNSNGSTKTIRECVICMVEFSKGDSIRFLPCLHRYHVHCIDEWLMRSFVCPTCMEPVDVGLINQGQW